MATRVHKGFDPLAEENVKVGRWRREQFEGLLDGRGIAARKRITLAKRLAESDADIRKAERMLGEGCSPDILVDILT